MPRPPSISPELMSTFVAVVHSDGDATRAAELLKVNQPSMSKRLAFLQHAGRVLRRPWIERVGKTWILTEEGRRVLPAVEELVHRYKLLTEAIDEVRPEVVFSCGSGALGGFVRRAIELFRARRPEGTFRVSSRPASDRVEGVGSGSLDLACVRLDEQETWEKARRPLHIEDLYDDTLVLVAAPALPEFAEFQALGDKPLPPRSLTRFPLILPEPDAGLRRDFDRRCREAGVYDRLRMVMEVGPCHTAFEYMRDGVGVGVVPKSLLAEAKGMVWKPLPPKLSPSNVVRVICRKKAGSDELDLSPAAKEFMQALRDAVPA